MWCPGDGRRELRRELAERQVLASALDDAEHGRVPERRRTAQAEDDLVTVGQREEGREAVAHPTHHAADAFAAVAGSEVGGPRRGERGERLGADLGGTR